MNAAPFRKGDRVVIDYPPTPGYNGVHGYVARAPRYKVKPKHGKTPGWWVLVVLDPPPGIKRWDVEIHANHVIREPKAEEAKPTLSVSSRPAKGRGPVSEPS